MEWIIQNLATITAGAIIFSVVGLIVFSMIRNRKKGKSSGCGGCSGCPMSGSCHSGK